MPIHGPLGREREEKKSLSLSLSPAPFHLLLVLPTSWIQADQEHRELMCPGYQRAASQGTEQCGKG